MHKKVETTKQTLHEAENRIVRQDKIRETCKELQERALKYEEKIRQRQESNAWFSTETGDFDFPTPLIDYDDDEDKKESTASGHQSISDETNSKEQSQTTSLVANIEKSDTVSTEDHVTTPITTAITAQQQQPQQQPQVLEEDQEPSSSSNEPEITIDLNDSVQRLEAK